MNKKTRLLIVSSTYPRWADDAEPGFVHELSRRLTADFEVTVVCPAARGAKREEVMEGVSVNRYRYAPDRLQTLVNDGGMVTNLKRSPWKGLLLPGFFLAQLFAVWRQVKQVQPDVIHAHWLVPQGFVLALLAVVSRDLPPFLVTSHGADLFALKSRHWMWIKRFVGRRAAALAVVSKAMRQTLQSQQIRCAHIALEPMGVDLETRFVPDPQVQRSGSELLFVGRLVEKKGLKYLIKALPAILEKQPETSLTVVGFGPEQQNLERQAAELGVADQVRFQGAVPQACLPDLYRRATLFVGPFIEAGDGDQEGLGLVTVEAIGCRCPVMVSDLPAVRDVIEESQMRVAPADSLALGSGIAAMLRTSEAEKQEMTERARQRLLKRFSWDPRARSYSALLQRVAGG